MSLVAPKRVKLTVTALRAFTRFLRFRGDITGELMSSALTVPNWRLSTLPKSISPERVERILAQCDRRTPMGRRDYAILLVLARLGLWFEFVDKAVDRVPSELWWWARFHGYMPSRRDDGSMNEIAPKTAWPDDYRPNWYPFQRAVTFAHSLVAISDSTPAGTHHRPLANSTEHLEHRRALVTPEA